MQNSETHSPRAFVLLKYDKPSRYFNPNRTQPFFLTFCQVIVHFKVRKAMLSKI